MANDHEHMQAHRLAVLHKLPVPAEFTAESAQCVRQEECRNHEQGVSAILQVQLQIKLRWRVGMVIERATEQVALIS